MSVLILSARPGTASNRRLEQAAAAARVKLTVVDATTLVADASGVLLTGDRERWGTPPPVVLARVGNWRPDSLLALLEAATAAGATTPNPASAVRTGRDHWRTARILAAAGIPFPTTVAGADPEVLAGVAASRLRFPVVVKQRRSRMGVGVIRCARRDHLEAVLDSLWRLGDEVVVQEYVETGGASLRCFVVGGETVAAARFTATGGEWRSNAARGGRVEALQPDAALAGLAAAAARTAGLGVCGVDLLPGNDGVVVGELNPTPGFVALEKATGADVASAVVDHLVALGG
ncbi:MAG: RimK family alpha-L-glutamate ligase [Thermoanaerobaculales bacterium]|nr:RimK family alpha-L-glutamate ligase [Thermoanaerobaculales bacterium]